MRQKWKERTQELFRREPMEQDQSGMLSRAAECVAETTDGCREQRKAAAGGSRTCILLSSLASIASKKIRPHSASLDYRFTDVEGLLETPYRLKPKSPGVGTSRPGIYIFSKFQNNFRHPDQIDRYLYLYISQVAVVVKDLSVNAEDIRDDEGSIPEFAEDPLRAWQPTSVFLPENPTDRGAW